MKKILCIAGFLAVIGTCVGLFLCKKCKGYAKEEDVDYV